MQEDVDARVRCGGEVQRWRIKTSRDRGFGCKEGVYLCVRVSAWLVGEELREPAPGDYKTRNGGIIAKRGGKERTVRSRGVGW